MSEITLNIYASGNRTAEPTKTLTSEGYDLMLGTVEDFIEIIDLDKMDDEKEILNMVIKGYDKLKPLLKDIFTGLTDEDIRGIRINELVVTVIAIGKSIVESMGILKTGKNQSGE